VRAPRNFNFGVGDVGWCIHSACGFFFAVEDRETAFRGFFLESESSELSLYGLTFRVLDYW
jgi:hypothetical protein